MSKQIYVVTYDGPFGFIKPWTAVRDSETFSQQFLTPSIIEGMEKKLFPETLSETGISKVIGHRLSYVSMEAQQEMIQTRGWNTVTKNKQTTYSRPTSILDRGILIEPVLNLAFENKTDAEVATTQHLCLCRNEDIVLPQSIAAISMDDFSESYDLYPGYELIFEKNEKSFLVGYHRHTKEPMYGWLKIVGNPIRINETVS